MTEHLLDSPVLLGVGRATGCVFFLNLHNHSVRQVQFTDHQVETQTSNLPKVSVCRGARVSMKTRHV